MTGLSGVTVAMEMGKRFSKYDHIICKTQISPGSPAVYRLKPKSERIGTLIKYVLGERNPNKPNKTVLLVGETGAGKSTLINALVNYAIGVKWEDNVYFNIVDDGVRDQSFSQTIDVIVYQIFGFEEETLPYSLTIIDTPGYGSIDRQDQDAVVHQKLFDLFSSEDGIHEIDAVGLVMKSTECRLTKHLSCVLDSVTSLFGKDVENSVVALMTHSIGQEPENALNALKAAEFKYATDKKNQPVYFLFNNCWKDSRIGDVEFLKYADKISRKGLEGFTTFLGRNLPLKLTQTVEVMKERIGLTACINSLQDKVRFLEFKRQEIEQIQEALKKHKEDMKKNKNFIITVDVPIKEKVLIKDSFPLFNFATTCSDCKENCHFPGCTFAISPSWCEVMVNGRCTVCTNKCKSSSHERGNFRYVIKIISIPMTHEDMKKKYQKNEKRKDEKTTLLNDLENEIESCDNKITELLEEAFQHVKRLDQIALNACSVSTLVHLDFLIEKLKEKNDQRKVEELTRIKHRMSEIETGWGDSFQKIINFWRQNESRVLAAHVSAVQRLLGKK